MRHLPFSFVLGLALFPGLASAQAEKPASEKDYTRASLVERTPFAKSERAGAKPVSGGPLELRGFYGSGKNLEVSLMKTDGKESQWVRVRDESSKWFVDSADPEAGTAVVRYDGLTLRLALVKPEAPSIVAPAAPVVAVTEDRPRGGRMSGGMSPAGREAFRNAMREGFERARKEHPEYFDGSKLTAEQQVAREEYMRDGWRRAREAVAKASPEDAAKLPENGGFGRRGGAGRDGEGAAPAQQPAEAPKVP